MQVRGLIRSLGLCAVLLVSGCAGTGNNLMAQQKSICSGNRVLLTVKRTAAPTRYRCVLKSDIEVLFDREGRETL